MHNHE